MPTLYAPTTQNAIQKTLDASLDAGVTAAATFNNMTGVQNLPGIFVVDRVDSNGVETPSKREYISFQTTSGSNVQTLARGLAGSTDQDHAVGAIVEFIPDVTWAQDLRDHLTTEHNTDGTHKNTAVVMMTGNQTIAGVKTFSSSPIVPTPTTDLQAATKEYVDAGWYSLPYTLVYASADDPTYTATVTGVDLTSVISPGMRIRVSQSTGGTKYFIVTAVAFSTDTTITLYGGTDYDLVNEAISSPVFSSVKAPVGFPLDPSKWSGSATSSSDFTDNSPSSTVWKHTTSLSLAIPIGAWKTRYFANVASGGSGYVGADISLSTANNSQSDSGFTTRNYGNSVSNVQFAHQREKLLVLGSKTTYYLVNKSVNVNTTSIIFAGSSIPTLIQYESAYL